MKKIVLAATLMLAFAGLQAQDCEALILPKFQNNREYMERCPTDKQMYYCYVARSAFYESDTIPAGAVVKEIGEVREMWGQGYLPKDYVVNLNTLSYFGYNFEWLQLESRDSWTVLCFRTPASAHPYLVLRSYGEQREMADRQFNEYLKENR